jgi:hypothetical protein
MIADMRNELLLHFPILIVLSPLFNNYVNRLPHQPLHALSDWVPKLMKVDVSFKAHDGKIYEFAMTLAIEDLLSHRPPFLFPSDKIITPIVLSIAILDHYILYSSIKIYIA